MNQHAYLVDDVDVTVNLLDQPLEWRVRAVDELLVDAATSCRRRRSLQCGAIREFLPKVEEDEAFVAVPLCSVPRGPLLDFDVEGPLGNAWLLPRLEIARRETAFLVLLARRAGVPVSAEVAALIEALVGFTDGSLSDPMGRRRPTVEFIEDGTEAAVSPSAQLRLRDLDYQCWSLLRPFSDDPAVPTAPEVPGLGVPRLVTSGLVQTIDEAVGVISDYARVIRQLSLLAQIERSQPAWDFLRVLADYGHNFDLIVATKVPVDEPFTLKFEERRDLVLSLWRNRGRQQLIIADAATNHVTFRVDDPNVRIAECMPRTREGSPTFGAFLPRQNEQTTSFYCYDDDRDYRTDLEFRLTLLKRLMFTPYLIGGLLYVLTAGLVIGDVTGARDVALVVGPATVAAGVLAVRENTTLGSRLRLLNSSFVAAGLAALVLATAWQVLLR